MCTHLKKCVLDKIRKTYEIERELLLLLLLLFKENLNAGL